MSNQKIKRKFKSACYREDSKVVHEMIKTRPYLKWYIPIWCVV